MTTHPQVKMIATLGPVSSSYDIIKGLEKAGTSLFRLNFSHGTHATHAENISHIRRVEEDCGRPLGILLDLQGPKIRIGAFKDASVHLQDGQTFCLDSDPTLGDAERVHLPHPTLFPVIQVGQVLLLDDGKIRLNVKAKTETTLTTIVEVGGILSSQKGVNLPGLTLPMTALTPKDKGDIQFGLTQDIDFICLSFVQRPEDILEARALVGDKLAIIAKIEKPAAVQSFDQIAAMADAIMIARGDLGVEMPQEDLPGLQKQFIRRCRQLGKPVVVATQMLESMVQSPTPTRAEVSDVATAVYDGADALMLTAETAIGGYPLEAISMMQRIIGRVEKDALYRSILNAVTIKPEPTTSDAITDSARAVAETIMASAIVTYTASGLTTQRASRARPTAPILGISGDKKVVRRLTLSWGVRSVLAPLDPKSETFIQESALFAKRYLGTLPGDKIVVTAGVPFGQIGSTNMLQVITV